MHYKIIFIDGVPKVVPKEVEKNIQPEAEMTSEVV